MTLAAHAFRKVSMLLQDMVRFSSATSWLQALFHRLAVSSVLVPVVLFTLQPLPTSHL